jgi:recombination protein RecA
LAAKAKKTEQSSAPKSEHEKLADILKLTQESLKDKTRALYGNDPRLVMDTVSTDVMELDRVLGGGWRRGRFGMVIGEASMGKTLVTQWTIAAFQKRGLVCGFIDPEHTFDSAWFEKTGVNTSKLIVFRPEHTEQAFDMASKWVENGIDLVVMDSVAALVPKMRAEFSLEEREVIGLSARKIGEGMMQLNNVNKDSFVLFTNQMRSKVGVIYGSPDTIPGGKAQRFMMSYIVHVRRGGWLPDNKDKQGYELKFITEKNKVCPPFMEGSVPFMFDGHIDVIGGLIELAKEFECVNSKSGYFRWDDQVLHGAASFKAYLEENPESRARLEALVKAAMAATPGVEDETDFPELDEELNVRLPDQAEYNVEEDLADLIKE